MEPTYGSLPVPSGGDGLPGPYRTNGATTESGFGALGSPSRSGATTSTSLRTVTRVGRDGAPVIEVYGELDIVTADPLRQVIESVSGHGCAVITVDLAGVPFCDLLGLEALVKAADRIALHCGRLTLTNPPSSLRRLLQVTGLQRRFHQVIDEGVRKPVR
jgi:anti-sigma B factor antagonist